MSEYVFPKGPQGLGIHSRNKAMGFKIGWGNSPENDVFWYWIDLGWWRISWYYNPEAYE